MDQSKKLYFKQSATEALHSAILLKARNPTSNNNSDSLPDQATETTLPLLTQTDSTLNNAASKNSQKLTLCPKLTNTNALLTISASMANSSQIMNNLNSTLDLLNNQDNNNINSHQYQMNENRLNNGDLDELDSPLKIKENILASIRNLKPVLIGLDPLRSSTSDDEDSHVDNVERKFKHCFNANNNNNRNCSKNEMNMMEQGGYENENSKGDDINAEVVLLGSTSTAPKQQQQQQNTFSLPSTTQNTHHLHNNHGHQQKHVYLRANSTNSKHLTKLPNCTNSNSHSNTILSIFSNQQQQQNQSTVKNTPVTLNKALSMTRLKTSASNPITTSASNKRGKEEALSNSSSSDEESEQLKTITTTITTTATTTPKQITTINLPTSLKTNLNTLNSSSSSTSTFKLQQLVLNQKQVPPPVTVLNSKTNVLLTLNMNNSNQQQPHITPVVNSAKAAADAAAAAALAASATALSTSNTTTSMNISNATTSSPPCPQYPSTNLLNNSECELNSIINSPPSSISSSFSSSSSSSPSSNSFKSQKSSIDSDYESKYTNSSSLSAASPTSCCSSTITNDGGIDLHDDNSSTASEPIYVRQPGFEHHAHEIVALQQQQQQQQNKPVTHPQTIKMLTAASNSSSSSSNSKSISNLNVNSKDASSSNKCTMPKLKKTETCSNLLNNLNSATSLNKTNTKAKKKLCMMNMDVSNLNINATNMNNSENNANNSNSSGDANSDSVPISLKPISNKAKREPLPMRLRALPMSFWQQPNQPNVSPATMYLPPLFKNEIDGVEDSNLNGDDSDKLLSEDSNQTRETRISAANTDLLFKLFDNIEQKDRKQGHLHLQSHFKMNRYNQKPLKTLSKALLKGEDPCILDAVSEGLFPLLRLDSRTETVNFLSLKATEATLNNLTSSGLSNSTPLICGNLTSPSGSSSTSNNNNNNNITSFTTNSINNNLAMNTLLSFNSNNNFNHFSNTQTLPILHMEQNFSQELSEVVAAL